MIEIQIKMKKNHLQNKDILHSSFKMASQVITNTYKQSYFIETTLIIKAYALED